MMAVTAAPLGPGQADPEQHTAELSPAGQGHLSGPGETSFPEPFRSGTKEGPGKTRTWSLAQTLLYDLDT